MLLNGLGSVKISVSRDVPIYFERYLTEQSLLHVCGERDLSNSVEQKYTSTLTFAFTGKPCIGVGADVIFIYASKSYNSYNSCNFVTGVFYLPTVMTCNCVTYDELQCFSCVILNRPSQSHPPAIGTY
jgi:hypothetical protein